MLQEEIEIDTNGKETIVKRAHNAADGERLTYPQKIVHGMKMVEFAEALQQEEV
jgi:hypothetical protein